MESIITKISQTNTLLWTFFGASLLFSFLTVLSDASLGLASMAFPFVGALYIASKARISKKRFLRWFIFILGVILSFVLLFINTFVCLGYCDASDIFPVTFGSIATFLFLSIFITGTVGGAARLVLLGIGGVLITWAAAANNAFHPTGTLFSFFGDVEPFTITISAIFLSSLLAVGVLREIKRLVVPAVLIVIFFIVLFGTLY